ncbi:hypothetical protein H7X69_01050 [Candidatus Saccharibacteria bacterium]|nr:hypothetical protein [Candidatus Saccharibacteria bacterium]
MIRRPYDEPPLPYQFDYLRAVSDIAQKLRRDEDGSLCALATYSERRMSESLGMQRYVERLGNIGLNMEDINDQTGDYVDQDTTSANAFVYGAIVGEMIIKRVHKERITVGAITDRMEPFGDTEEEDALNLRRKIIYQVLDRGTQGLRLVGTIGCNVLKDLETEIVPDSSKPHMLRAGCGVVLRAAADIHRDIVQVNFAKSLAGAHDYDWDSRLIPLVQAEAAKHPSTN